MGKAKLTPIDTALLDKNPYIDTEVVKGFKQGRARLYQTQNAQFIVLDGGKE